MTARSNRMVARAMTGLGARAFAGLTGTRVAPDENAPG